MQPDQYLKWLISSTKSNSAHIDNLEGCVCVLFLFLFFLGGGGGGGGNHVGLIYTELLRHWCSRIIDAQ